MSNLVITNPLAARIRQLTVARVGLARAGAGLTTVDHLCFQRDHARAVARLNSGYIAPRDRCGLGDRGLPCGCHAAIPALPKSLLLPEEFFIGRSPVPKRESAERRKGDNDGYGDPGLPFWSIPCHHTHLLRSYKTDDPWSRANTLHPPVSMQMLPQIVFYVIFVNYLLRVQAAQPYFSLTSLST